MRLQYKIVNKSGDVPTHSSKLEDFSLVRSRFRMTAVGTMKAISLMATDAKHPNTAFIGSMKDLEVCIGCRYTPYF